MSKLLDRSASSPKVERPGKHKNVNPNSRSNEFGPTMKELMSKGGLNDLLEDDRDKQIDESQSEGASSRLRSTRKDRLLKGSITGSEGGDVLNSRNASDIQLNRNAGSLMATQKAPTKK